MTTIDYAKARELMVEQQVRPWDVLDRACSTCWPRCRARPSCPTRTARWPTPTCRCRWATAKSMMKPVVEGRMLQALALQPGDEVLEIGTGSGFLTACLGRLAREVRQHRAACRPRRRRARAPGRAGPGRQRAHRSRRRLRLDSRAPLRRDLRHRRGRRDSRALPASGCGRAAACSSSTAARRRWKRCWCATTSTAPRIESLFETDLPYLVGAAPAPDLRALSPKETA